MEPCLKSIMPLSPERYAKVQFRRQQANLPYPEKVRQVVAMQHRLVPIYAARGRTIAPWRISDSPAQNAAAPLGAVALAEGGAAC